MNPDRRSPIRHGGYVFIGVSLYVCLLAELCKNYSVDFRKIRWKGGTRAAEEPLDFGGNPGHVTLGLGLGLGSGGGSAILCLCATQRSSHSNNCSTSAALAEVYALLSAAPLWLSHMQSTFGGRLNRTLPV